MTGTAETLAVLIAAPFPEVVSLHQALTDGEGALTVCSTVHTAAEVRAQSAAMQPDVVLLSDGLGADVAEVARAVRAASPSSRLVVLSEHPQTEPAALGAAVVLGHAVGAEALREAIRAATRLADQPDAVLRPPPAVSSHTGPRGGRPVWLRVPEPAPGSADPAGATAGEATEPGSTISAPGIGLTVGRRSARVIVVLGGKGGVGKSVVATNVAVSLAQRHARVAIVDFDRTYGDVGVMLRVEAHPGSAEDLIDEAGEFDPARLEQTLATGPSGLRALLTSSSARPTATVAAPAVAAILAELSRRHDFVVVDTASPLDEPALAALSAADTVLVVTAFSITSVKDTRILLKALSELGADDRVGVVLNQLRPRILFARADIERSLGRAALTHLPYEATVDDTIDAGVPIVISEPRAEISRQLVQLADELGEPDGLAPDAHEPVARRRFGRRR